MAETVHYELEIDRPVLKGGELQRRGQSGRSMCLSKGPESWPERTGLTSGTIESDSPI